MNKRCVLYKVIAILFIIASLGGLSSCTPQLKPSPEASNEDEEKEPPKELEELKKSIGNIEKTLMSMHEEKKRAQQGIISSQSGGGQGQQDQQQGQGGQQGQQSQQQGQQQGSMGQGQIQIQMKPEELAEYQKQQEKAKLQEELAKKGKETLEKFEGLKKDVLELHEKWNSFEPKAVVALASQKSMEDFENALNNLTDTIQLKDEYVNLLSVNSLYKTLPDFYELYKTKEPPDLDRLRYGIKKVKLVAEKDDYNSMKLTLEYLINVWSAAKPKLKKSSSDLMNKFEFALNDLKKSIEGKNKTIIDAKSEVLLKIIDEMVQSLKK
ncbi:hypothetical protein [Lutispora saccharofermentans]|uniref:Uncharacterized protein n=1 Tax=Lutispora saccharofermentans TaxID=3024236 RepID=A0ABT1NHP3_9FIRM|nr:hypothetical protein [Lutispora saccharofermentans]MCQ1530787.1 hypothetical protein [Lutispora saccharofermentans]